MAEFYRLLSDSQFVAKVIEIYCSDRSTLERHREPGDSTATIVKIQVDSQWKSLVKKHLADWLFRITDILTTQAKFASRGYSMSRAELAALIDDAFLRDAREELELRDRRNEIWNAYTLKLAINTILPEIKTSGAVTLTTVAKKITAHAQALGCCRSKTALTGKHLQKLLKIHSIDWMAIKRSYTRHLACTTLGPMLKAQISNSSTPNTSPVLSK